MKHHLPLFVLLSCAASVLGADLPTPELLLRPGPLKDGAVPLTLPAGTVGELAGAVTAEAEGLIFSGTGGTVTIPFDARQIFGEPFTVSARIEPHDIKGYGNILEANQPSGFCLLIHGHGMYSVSGGGPAQWNKVKGPKGSVKLGATQHVAVTWDGIAVVLYVDGAEAGRGEFEGTPAAGDTIVLGSRGRTNEAGDITDVSDFRLEEIAIFRQALTAEQIKNLAEGATVPEK